MQIDILMPFSLLSPPSPQPNQAEAKPSLGWMLLLAVALFALALPVIGPLDDHHFVERAHNHDHIYLNGWPVQHDHAYRTGSAHLHAAPLDVTSETGSQRPAAGTVFLSPVTSGLMLASMNAPQHPAPESLRPPPPRHQANPLERFTHAPARVRGQNVSPPLPPPVV